MSALFLERGRPWAVMLLAVGLLAILPGCGVYQLQGKVVQGDRAQVLIVDSNDSRLQQQGVEGAKVEVTIDPASMHPQQLGGVASDESGSFRIPVPQPGAGVLEYEAGVLCRVSQHLTTWETLPLPAPGKRLLIVVAPGKDNFQPQRDVLQETLEEGKQLERRQ